MTECVFSIVGGNFDEAGSASGGLKALLKKIGADAEAVRRAMIAAYEAEMNVVIHAQQGEMRVSLAPSRLDVDVVDEGPGIADLDLALKEGYSTAPQSARDLGFGAGMGLPNIRRNSNRFSIRSTVGQGTHVSFSIFLTEMKTGQAIGRSVKIAAERCTRCLRCLFVCPTRAVRLRAAGPEILGHLCVDCTACIEACAPRALVMETPDEASEAAGAVLVIPTGFPHQFGERNKPAAVTESLLSLGFAEVHVLGEWEEPLREAVLRYAREEAATHPVLSPVCPAVLNLVEIRYPSLLKIIAPFLSPVEAAREDLTGRRTVFMAACPSQCSFLTFRRSHPSSDILDPCRLRRPVQMGLLKNEKNHKPLPESRGSDSAGRGKQPLPDGRGSDIAVRGSDSANGDADTLHASGLRHVAAILERMENGRPPDALVLELYACDQGCFGTPLLFEDAFLARRLFDLHQRPARHGEIFRRTSALRARAGMRLDEDMTSAISKLSRIEGIEKSLPGRDCGVCGAPACGALAEDIVTGRAESTACPYLSETGVRP